MYAIDQASTERFGGSTVVDVAVRDLYRSAVRVCARADPERHTRPLRRWGRMERAVTARDDPYGERSTIDTDVLRARVRAYVAQNDDVADEASSIMERLERMLVLRGAHVIARGPDTVRCTVWHRRCFDWLDDVIDLKHPGAARDGAQRPGPVCGSIFGRDYVARVDVARYVS